jgi:hypothetical protein
MLFDVQRKNRLSQKGVLRRFSITCYGKQGTLADMRNLKTKKYEELKNKRNSKEYEEWFLMYKPGEKNSSVKNDKKQKITKKKKIKKNKKTRKVIDLY